MEQESLLKKLLDRVVSPCYNRGCQVFKRITGLMLVAGMVITAAGCDFSTIPVGPAGSTTTQQQGGPSNPNKPGDESTCSEILRNVLTDSNYKSLESMSEAAINRGDYGYALNNNSYKAIPYGFLEDEGYDIEKIKTNKLSCNTQVYRVDNDLFLDVSVETKSSKSYLTHYVLKYSLTDQEVEDLNDVCVSLSSLSPTTSYQSPFFIQELSYLKTPEVLSTSHTTQKTVDLVEASTSSKLKKSVYCFYTGHEESGILTYKYYWHVFKYNPNSSNIIQQQDLYTLRYSTSPAFIDTIDNKTVFNHTGENIDVGNGAIENMLKNPQTIYFYNLRPALLKPLDSNYIQEHFYK